MKKLELEQLVEQGLTIYQIGDRVGKSSTTVRYWLKKHGLKTKKATNRATWTEGQMVSALSNNTTIADVLRELGLVVRPGNYSTVKNFVKKYNIDLSHMIGKSHGTSAPNQKPLEEVLVKNSSYSRGSIKKRLIKEGLLEEKCAYCGQGNVWKGRRLVLVLDHANGVNDDNRKDNLRFLCPNCNSQQSTFCRGKKKTNFIRNDEIRPKQKFICPNCGGEMCRQSKRCMKCQGLRQRKVPRPTSTQLEQDNKTMSWVAIGKNYGVSDNAVRKWAKQYGLIQ